MEQIKFNNNSCEIYHDFVSSGECKEIISWMENNKELFVTAMHPGTNRLTTRSQQLKIKYPEVVYNIQNRIIKHLELKNYELVPTFSDGVYLSFGFAGDACEAHKDPVYITGYKTYHCNVLLGEPEGGAEVIIERKNIKLLERDLMVYPVSELEHATTKLIGDKTRYLAVFGFCIPNE